MWTLTSRLLCLVMLSLATTVVLSQSRNKHDLGLVVEATAGMAPIVNDLYTTFEFLQAQHHELRRRISSYVLSTFDFEGSGDVVRVRSPRHVASSLPLALSARSPNCQSQVLKAIMDAVRATDGCADVIVVTQSVPSDGQRLEELLELAAQRKAHISIFSVHSCAGDQSAYDTLSSATGGHRVHLQPAQRAHLRRLISMHVGRSDAAVLVSGNLQPRDGSIDFPFTASVGMNDFVLTARCPLSAIPPVVALHRISGASTTAPITEQVGDLVRATASSLQLGAWTASISGVAGECHVTLAAATMRKYGFGWHRTPAANGFSDYLLLTAASAHIDDVTAVQLHNSDGVLVNNLARSQSLQLGDGTLIFGPLLRPAGRPRLLVVWSSGGFPTRQLADDCQLSVALDALDQFNGGDTSQGGAGVETVTQLPEPAVGFGPCAENEVFRSCGSECPETCAPRRRSCRFVCVRGCFCRAPYVRDTSGGRCVPRGECPTAPAATTVQQPTTEPQVPVNRPASGCVRPSLSHGNALVIGGPDIAAGDAAYFICDPGYKLAPGARPSQTCSDSGAWEPTAEQQCVSTVSAPVLLDDQLRNFGACQYVPCSAVGSPQPLTKWEYEGRVIKASYLPANMHVYPNHTLRICGGKPHNSGTYKCTAWNQGGTTTRSYPIFFGSKPVINQTDIPQQNKYCVTLPCRATGVPMPTITWLRNDQSVAMDNEDYRLDGDSLLVCNGRPALAGLYECQATNSAGMTSRQYQLSFNPLPTRPVTAPPVEPGASAVLIAQLRSELRTLRLQQVADQQALSDMQSQLEQCQRNG